MASILAELQNLVSPELRSEMARQTHESDEGLRKATDAAIPAFAATIASRSDDSNFMNQLVSRATGFLADTDATRPIAPVDSSPTDTNAGGWLALLFGQNLSPMTTNLARYAGIRESSASSLLISMAPLVLGYFGRLIRRHNLGATDLAARLRAERPAFEAALPAGFEMPGVRKPFDDTPRAVEDDTRERHEWRRQSWATPLAVLAALAVAGLIWWANQPSSHREMARTNIVATQPKAVGTRGTIEAPLPRPVAKEPSFGFAAGTAEDRLATYLAASTPGTLSVDLNRVNFATGSSTLTPESRAQVENLAAILRAYPKATAVVEGHTDNVGRENANRALSQARAQAVAKALTDAGISDDRVHAEGYGSQKPVADNATAEGRSQNRRVTIEVSR